MHCLIALLRASEQAVYTFFFGRSRRQALKENPVAYANVTAKRAEAAR
jgi:hypothetical protein